MPNDEPLRGLGALIAEKFAAEGCNVAINYNASRERAEQVAEKLEKEYHGSCISESFSPVHFSNLSRKTFLRSQYGGLTRTQEKAELTPKSAQPGQW